MTATNEAWISDSLARLEQLEAQRDQLARSGRTDALAELDEEIKSLYEVLESAAESEGTEAANTSPAPSVPHPAFGPTPYPMASAAPVQSYAPQPVAQQPVYAPEQQYAPQPDYAPQAEYPPQPMMPVDAPEMMASSYDGDDEPSSGKGAIIGIAVVLLLAAGGGGWWFMNRTTEAPVVEAPAGPAKVIQAGAIPEDTQEPDVAKGGAASRTPGIVIKQPQSDDRRPSARPSGSSSPRPGKPDKPGRSDIDVANGNDPLAGVK